MQVLNVALPAAIVAAGAGCRVVKVSQLELEIENLTQLANGVYIDRKRIFTMAVYTIVR